MAYFDELLQRAITVRNNRAPASNTADLVGGVLVGIVTALQMLLDDKQDELTFDTAPTADSQNPVTSDGIYQALQAIDLSACEKIVNKVTSINAQSTDVQYPSAKLLYDSLQALSGIYAAIVHTHAIADIINLQTELNARQLVSNLVTAITAQSTDVQYPSAKLLYDQLQGLDAVYAPKVHTHPFADIERPANVASVNAQGYTITTAYYSHVLTITADVTLHLPTMQSGAAIILRLTIIQDATGGRAVTFDGGAALVFNPYQTDLSLGQANYRCWVVLWFDGVNWAWLASPYVLRAESQFAYTIDGTTGGQYVTVTINGTTMQIQATSGVWQYGYNNPINSIAFTGDTGVLNVDFTNSDGLANITTLADAFKNCAALVAVDFTGCDLSSVATATDCFAGCTSLAALTIPTGTWKPDIDLSACAAFTKAAMLAVIDGLYTYASGTHTVTFNSTAWNALSVADQQAVSDAAAAKGWTTNAVAVSYVIRGTSTNVGGSETFNIQFIQDGAQTPDAAETITCAVDSSGNWEYAYSNKNIYSLDSFAVSNNRVTSVEFTETLNKLVSMYRAFDLTSTMDTITFANGTTFSALLNGELAFHSTAALSINLQQATFESLTNATNMFRDLKRMVALDLRSATFESLTYLRQTFSACANLESINLSSATFDELISIGDRTYNEYAFVSSTKLTTLDFSATTFPKLEYAVASFSSCSSLQSITFNSQTKFNLVKDCGFMFADCGALTTINGLDSATFEKVTDARGMFRSTKIVTLTMPSATFELANNNASGYGNHGQFYNCSQLVTLTMPNATFNNLSRCPDMFYNCVSLINMDVPQNSTAILPTSSASYAPMNMRYSPLTYASMLKVANWLTDLTGYSAHTCTFKTSAWNALTAAEQSNIDTILSGKNWTRVLA